MPADRSEFDPVELLTHAFRQAIASIEGAPADADPLITPSKRAELGDFQSNAAMPLAKILGRKPREIASELAEKVGPLLSDLVEPLTDADIAGPGFINVRLKPEALARLLAQLDSPALGLEAPAEPETVVVDLCGVNLAKQMHVGHLRSTVIGDALARLFERLGHTVIRQNHVGDWGLPIAMVTRTLMEQAAQGKLDLDAVTLDDLDRLYKEAKAESTPPTAKLKMWRAWARHPKVDAEFEDDVRTLEGEHEAAEANLSASKQTLVRLQNHDAEVEAVWQKLYDVTIAACLDNCARLKTRITEQDSAGESSYREELAPLVADLIERGVAEEEAGGAVVVRVGGIEEPCLVRKSDGGYLYATTDVAAIRRRVRTLGAHRVVYCVDARQALHFRQVFGAAHKAGYATTGAGEAKLEHAAFGMVLGEDRRPFKTRSGENIRLSELLDEAIARAGEKVAESSPDTPEAERLPIAEVVGIAAIKYADLSNDRIKDYVFSYDRMVALQGNTGPYLLYALARIKSIFRKAAELGIDTAGFERAPLAVGEPAEKALAMQLLAYPSSVRRSAEHLEPHRLCAYLYDLAGAFSGFFEHCPVLKGEAGVRASRLRLCALTARVLEDGLETLGIPHVDRM
ncbi:MAG: arginine--tRNA ligase [Phycisphaerales bacterium]|nr:MAG: arginine--tRNA ligase [Phycisphaerales bacterium]